MILYDIIISPIEAIIEFVFCFTLEKFPLLGVGGATVAVSLAVNFLALPIYNVADEIQLKERELQKKMSRWVTHIKKAFKGDEQFMILSEYYRLNNYHPVYALRQSLSVLIQIPFFIAAYHFLSHCPLLEGQSILFLKDLSKSDGLVRIMEGGTNSLSINILPILMTLINVVSSVIYTKGAPLREKIQTFALALVFLVLLYNSPSGLVFYWVLNQIFSLCKNLVKKLPRPGRVVHIFLSEILVFASIYVALGMPDLSAKKKCVVYIFATIFIIFPFLWQIFMKGLAFERLGNIAQKPNALLLFTSCLSLWFLCGLVLPANIIATSPSEFSFLGSTDSPLSYIHSSFVFFFGLFVFWPLCIYKLFDNKIRFCISFSLFVLALCALANAFIFNYDYGTISIFFRLDDKTLLENYSAFYMAFPFFFVVFIIFIFWVLEKLKKTQVVSFAMLALCTAEIGIGVFKYSNIKTEFDEIATNRKKINSTFASKELVPEFHLSKTKENVVILFLDRAISAFFPYILEQFPELNESYDGFVYYPNCLSFGGDTMNGSPPLIGGYDYMPSELRKDSRLLVEKHNEALLCLPKNFADAGFDVTLVDLPYANYKWDMDLDFFKQFDFLTAKTFFSDTKYKEHYIAEHYNELSSVPNDYIIRKNIKEFNVMQILFPILRKAFYHNGKYYNVIDYYYAGGYSDIDMFLRGYSALYYLPELTDFDNEKPAFVFFENIAPHSSLKLCAPDYHPGIITEESPDAGCGFYEYMDSAKDYNGDYEGYQVNAACLLQVAKWLDYLKESGVYDNTRIIIVSDHGFRYMNRKFESFKNFTEATNFNPLFIMKDFNAHGSPRTDDNLITNAETPYLATKNLAVSDVNSFTGKKFRQASDFKDFEVIKISDNDIMPHVWLDKTEFRTNKTKHYLVHDNIFDEANWKKLDTSEVEK